METKLRPKPELDDSGLIELISQYEKSNMSVAEFCEYNEIDETTFSVWQKRHHKLKNPKGAFKRADPFAGSSTSGSDTVYAEMVLPSGIIFRLTSPLDVLFIKALI